MIFIVMGRTGKGSRKKEWPVKAYRHLEFARNHAYHAEQIAMCIEATYEEKMKHGRDLKENPHDPFMQMVYETGTSYFVMEVELDESDR